ncbi:MAG: alpha/beta fold hydrolase [Pseudomonadota bacterium]
MIAVFDLAVLAALLCFFALFTSYHARRIEKDHPPIGSLASVDGHAFHYVIRGDLRENVSPIVVIHGASGNLSDTVMAFEGLAFDRPVIFIDRPGLGWSERATGRHAATPRAQAKAVLQLLDSLDVTSAHVIGHSFGVAVALAMALEAPSRVERLALLSPVSHPWPGGVLWYYQVAALPVVGALFARTLVMPIGLRRVPCASNSVFSPSDVPESYAMRSGAELVLTPKRFQANARDIVGLFAEVTRDAPAYYSIENETLIVTGDADTVVWPSIHASALATSLPRAGLHVLENTGHMSHHHAATHALLEAFFSESNAGREDQRAA